LAGVAPAQQVLNGGFADGTGWGFTRWTLGGGVITSNATGAAAIAIYTFPAGALVQGATYSYSIDITTNLGEQVDFYLGADEQLVDQTAAEETLQGNIVADAAHTTLRIHNDTNATGVVVDNISLFGPL
jgi:hypothetical protein